MRSRKPRSRKRTISGGLLVGVLVLVAAACGGDDSQDVGEPAPLASVLGGTPVNEVENAEVGGLVLGAGDRADGSGWLATSVKGLDVFPQFPSITLLFDATGRVDGSSGCNQYGGTYEAQGGEITITVGPTTRVPCVELQGEQERRFLESLHEAAEFEINGNELTLWNANGAPVAIFEAV